MKTEKIVIPKAGEWFGIKSGECMSCCDCGLVHRYKFKIKMSENGKEAELWMRAWRNEELTKKRRIKNKYIIKIK